jgi:glycosyltransferase involved in cell wall biosynthesis
MWSSLTVKILYLVHQFFPEYHTGTEKFILGLARMAQNSGHKVKVIAYSLYPDSFYDELVEGILWKEYSFKGIYVVVMKQKNPPKDVHHNFENPALSKIASQLIQIEKPDIVHVGHSMRISKLIEVLPTLNIPYIITLTDFFNICPKYNLITSKDSLCDGPRGGDACQKFCPEYSYSYISKRLELSHAILSQAQAITCPSHFAANLVKKEFPDLKIQVINHGMRINTLKRSDRTYTDKQALIFGYASSLNVFKGVHILIEAFKRVPGDSLKLKIYGSGEKKAYVKQIEKMAKGDKRIEFCGVYAEEQLGDVLTNLDAIVIPSLWYENYPLIFQEAFACEVPVIASKIGMMAETIEDKVNGFLFEMGNVEHLAAVLQTIATKPSILNTVKQKLKERPILTLAQEAYTYSRLYHKIVSQPLQLIRN